MWARAIYCEGGMATNSRVQTGAATARQLHMLACAALSGLLSDPLHAAEPATTSSPRILIGVLAHDQGPASDHHEHGIDLNLEAQFAPLNIMGKPRPHIGATLNFNGDTSVAYAGLTFPIVQTGRWLLEGAISAAVHDGPLHKDAQSCQNNSDCGFGSRILPRGSLELGYRLNAQSAVTVFYDHMSHKGIIGGENEGIDHIGLRYRRDF